MGDKKEKKKKKLGESEWQISWISMDLGKVHDYDQSTFYIIPQKQNDEKSQRMMLLEQGAFCHFLRDNEKLDFFTGR